jgi:cytochrome c2
MRKRRAILAMGLGFCSSISTVEAASGFTWDEGRLDAWLTNPQTVIPGAIMTYRQTKAETRAAIITYRKGLN